MAETAEDEAEIDLDRENAIDDDLEEQIDNFRQLLLDEGKAAITPDDEGPPPPLLEEEESDDEEVDLEMGTENDSFQRVGGGAEGGEEEKGGGGGEGGQQQREASSARGVLLFQYEASGPKTSSSGAPIGAGHELFSKFCRELRV